MNISEILIVIVNTSILILPIIMLIENLLKRKYKILNVCMLINMLTWVYLSYIWNVRNPGFWVKCDARVMNLIASIVLIASIITMVLQLKNKKGNKILIMIGGMAFLLPAAPFLALAGIGLIVVGCIIYSVIKSFDE